MDLLDQAGTLSEKDQEERVAVEGFMGERLQRVQLDARHLVQTGAQCLPVPCPHLGSFDPDRLRQVTIELLLGGANLPLALAFSDAFPALPEQEDAGAQRKQQL